MNPQPLQTVPPADSADAGSELSVLAFLWGNVGTFACLVSLAALLGMMSEQGPFDALKMPEFGAYTLTMFSVPLLSAMISFLTWVGCRHVKIAPSVPGSAAIPVGWRVFGLGTSGLRTHMAVISVVVCLGIPMFVDVWSLGKFVHGTYYRLVPSHGDCRAPIDDKKCTAVGTVIVAFVPGDSGIGNPIWTQYRYEGNVDFVPIVEPVAYLIGVTAAICSALRFIYKAFRAPRSVSGPGVVIT